MQWPDLGLRALYSPLETVEVNFKRPEREASVALPSPPALIALPLALLCSRNWELAVPHFYPQNLFSLFPFKLYFIYLIT